MATFFQRLPEDKTQPPTDAADSVRVLARGASIPRLTENDRIAKYMIAAADVVERHTGSKEGGACLRASAPIIAGVFWVAVKVAPIYALLLQKGKWVYDHAPKDVLQMIFGLALCFFGGTYVAAIAAVEAWRHMGWQRSYADARHVWDETQGVVRASLRDDMVDDDKNGIADVDEMTPAMLAQRKVTLAMTTVSDPDKLANSVGALWGAYLAVLATLRLEFARVVALALGIAEMVKFPIVRVVAPPLSAVLGPELKHWVPTIITTVINFLVIGFAWYLQKVVSAFNSALRGGRMFGAALFSFLDERGVLAKLPCFPKDKAFDPNDSYLDEAVGYIVAAAGFYTQLAYGFHLAFPVNLILLPLSIVEWILEWQIVMGTGAPIPSG